MTSPEEVFGGAEIIRDKDIEAGMYVAAIKPPEPEESHDNHPTFTPGGQGGGPPAMGGIPVLVAQPDEEDDLLGLPLYVAHVSFPLAAVIVVPDGRRAVRDVRDYTFVKVPPGFAAFMVHREYYEKRHPQLLQTGKVESDQDLVERSARVSEAQGKQVTDALNEEEADNE